MWKKAILPVETFNSRKLMLRFLAEAANFSKREVTANSNTVCFHTQEQTVCMVKASWGLNAAGACWIKVTNVKATVNLFSFFYQQVIVNGNKTIILPSPTRDRRAWIYWNLKLFFSCFFFFFCFFSPLSQQIEEFVCKAFTPSLVKRIVQASIHQHGNNDEFPDLNTICNKVTLPEQEMQREGFTVTLQIRARKPCQSKHNYWEGSAWRKSTVRSVSYHRQWQSHSIRGRLCNNTGVHLLTQVALLSSRGIPCTSKCSALWMRLAQSALVCSAESSTKAEMLSFSNTYEICFMWKNYASRVKSLKYYIYWKDYVCHAYKRTLRNWGYNDSIR